MWLTRGFEKRIELCVSVPFIYKVLRGSSSGGGGGSSSSNSCCCCSSR